MTIILCIKYLFYVYVAFSKFVIIVSPEKLSTTVKNLLIFKNTTRVPQNDSTAY